MKADMVTLTATPPPPISGDAALTAAPPSPTREAIVPRELGPVVLIRELGRGGMGTVWLARHELLNRPVAVKFILNADERIDPGFCMFLTGARAAAAVRHLGLTSILHADLTEGLPYIVMEYVEGPTLAEVLRKCGPFNSEQAVAAIWQVSDAVAELHEHSIIHRDIKPANVLLDREGKTYVTDFGLACVRQSGGGRIVGTPPYMAPEMFDGRVSLRSDVFAISVTAYELLTQRVPERSSATHEITSQAFDRLRESKVDEALIDLIERGMHKDPIFRFKNAGYFAQALKGRIETSSPNPLLPLVTSLNRPPNPATVRHAPTATSAAGYYESLAGLAEAKRSSPVSTPVTELRAEPADLTGLIRVSLPCATCGYDLRFQPYHGVCPECGHGVSESTFEDRLIFMPRGAVRRLARSLNVLAWILWIMEFGGPGFTIGPRQPPHSAPGAPSYSIQGILYQRSLIFGTFGALLAVAASISALTALAQNIRGGSVRPLRLRAIAIVAMAVSTPIMTCLMILPLWSDASMVSHLLRLYPYSLLVWTGVACPLFFAYVATILSRLPDRDLRKDAVASIIVLLLITLELAALFFTQKATILLNRWTWLNLASMLAPCIGLFYLGLVAHRCARAVAIPAKLHVDRNAI